MMKPVLPPTTTKQTASRGRIGIGRILAILSAFVAAPALAEEPPHSGDLFQHPLYRAYAFGQDDTVIDLGMQPFRFPAGLVMETMRHDLLLTGALKGMGLTVRFHPFLKGSEVHFFLHAGKLEGGTGGDIPTLTACALDRVRVVTLVELDFTSLIASRWMRVSELRGKRIGVSLGTNAHYGLLRALETVGLREGDVNIEDAEVQELPGMLIRKEVDAISSWDIISTLTERRGNGKVLHRVLARGYLYFGAEFTESRPEAVRQLIAAQIRALDWLERTEENLLRAVEWTRKTVRGMTGRDLELSREELARQVARSLRHLGQAPLLPERILDTEGPLFGAVDFLSSHGKLPVPPSPEELQECFQRQTALQVMADPVGYRLDHFDYTERSPE
ncbi:MAG: hypothetical protein HQL57_08705 [Magnetococcales bacterium]|nr:hypothetical protein [Magnetococcales bacterium]MBF0157248.1 hypothetical protein [Magnetococcales bacterium]